MEISANEADPEELSIQPSHLNFPVVGIGASAGGLGALQGFFSEVGIDCQMAFVVVMHLSPDHDSALGSILQRVSALPVTTALESVPIRSGQIYVIPPSKKLAMVDGSLVISDMVTLEGRRQSVDIFFRSLAEAHQERAICIVLSGTGTDGAQGLRRIKERGGVAFAQSPDDAEFDGMPRAAVQTGGVDFVMPVGEMPRRLEALWANAKIIALPNPPSNLKVDNVGGEAALLAEEALISIKSLLRERTGHDFSEYKRGTVLRRLERRMQVTGQPDLPSYRRLLESHSKETGALLQDMLISVTNFFRDPEAFEAFESQLRHLIERRPTHEPFRAWIAGCATGEEAYSVAILLRELLPPDGPPAQVFASDIDGRAVAVARTGLYPQSIASDVSPDRLTRFFLADPGGYRIAKSVRDGMVFSAHNVLSDPPFTRMDLICCRNLLIYLERSAQAQLLRSFNFSLKPDGLLFLGNSETADAAQGMFDAEDRTHRLYRPSRAIRQRTLPPLDVRPYTPAPATPRTASADAHTPTDALALSPLEALHEKALRRFGPPSVLVDADDTVLHVSQRADRLLRLPEGAPSNKLLSLARPELRAELRAALSRAAETGLAVEAPRVRLMVNGAERHVVITVTPVSDQAAKGLMLVVFGEADESLALATGGPGRDPLVESLEADLMRSQVRLRHSVGESSVSTEELRASNEELQTINEELRSTTEELETSREELQAVNEELRSVNTELGLRVEETGRANDDLQNLMTSAEIGAVFVDREMRVKRFTPQAATVFNLRPSDVGRPLLDITHRLDYPQLALDVRDVLRDLGRAEREVAAEDGRRLLARVLPYLTSERRIEGAVLAFFDVTARRSAEERLRLSEQRMGLVAESMRDYAIVTTDAEGAITTWSVGAERIFGYSATEAIGEPIGLVFTPEDRLSGEPAKEMRDARTAGRANDDRWLARKDGELIYCSGIMTPLGPEGREGFAKIARDFTQEELDARRRELALVEEREASARLQEANTSKDEFLAVVSHELKNPLAVIQMSAQLLTRLPGFDVEPRAKRVADAIKAAVASQAQIINDLLDLTRSNMGKVTLAPVTLAMGELVRTIIDAVAPEVTEKRLALEASIGEANVLADSVRLEQIVWNLVTNAVKFTPEGGKIRVALASEGAMARLDVEDSGIGIEPRHLSSIFEMFRQVETGSNRKRPGLGIGLALVKQLAELHGGRVAARSAGLGRGSSFHVWLPIATRENGAAVARSTAGGFDGLRILLVDDEPELLDLFASLLRSEGASVEIAPDAPAALELAHEREFDVVVSDVAMPEHDGYWLAREFRADGRGAELPLIAVSGMGRGVDRRKALDAGFDAHLSKPLDLDALREAIAIIVPRKSSH